MLPINLSVRFIRAQWLQLVALACLMLSLGCDRYSAAEHRVDTSTARSILEEVLASWQQGNTPESWQSHDPEVIVQDLDWKSGAKLQDFEILGQGEAIDANYYIQVKLTFDNPINEQRERTVTYLVGTSPVITVFRSPTP